MICYAEKKGKGECRKKRCSYSHDPKVPGKAKGKGKDKASKGKHKKGKGKKSGK
jgi:hypothetical protein